MKSKSKNYNSRKWIRSHQSLALFVFISSLLSGHAQAQNQAPNINWATKDALTNAPSQGSFKQQPVQQPQQAPAGAPVQKSPELKPGTHLMNMDVKSIIIVGGKQTTVGEAKKKFQAELKRKIGPIKTTKAKPRKLDLSTFQIVSPTGKLVTSNSTPLTGLSKSKGEFPAPAPGNSEWKTAARVEKSGLPYICKTNELPQISNLSGRLIAGRKVVINGTCFGDRSGSVELIGPFPGGKLKLPFTSWNQFSVALEIPATIRGVADQTISISVITANGKATPAMPAQFIATRERLEVPDRYWTPNASFNFTRDSVTKHEGGYNAGIDIPRAIQDNEARIGQTPLTLRINPQCSLESMSVDVLAADKVAIFGWENPGPANEANPILSWVGTCHATTYLTSGTVLSSSSETINATCTVSFKARAWAYCPAGISP